MELTPTFKLIANDNDVTASLNKNLISLEFSDEDGNASDEITLRVYGSFSRPKYQDELKLYLGYEGKELFFCGIFKVQTTQRIDNHILIIKASGADFSEKLKQRKSRSFEKMSISAICELIASEHNLTCKSDLTDLYIIHQAQNNEGDLHFLKRLATEYDAIFSIKNNTLIFLKRNEESNKSASLPEFNISALNCTSIDIKHSNKSLYYSCKAIWHDTKENTKKEVLVGSGEPVLMLESSFSSEAEARAKATARLNLANRGIKSGSLSCAGFALSAGGKLNLSGTVNSEDDGVYSIKSVFHRFDSGGWIVDVEFEN